MIYMRREAERDCDICGRGIYPDDYFYLKDGIAVCEDCGEDLTGKEMLSELGFEMKRETMSDGEWYDG